MILPSEKMKDEVKAELKELETESVTLDIKMAGGFFPGAVLELRELVQVHTPSC